ncbi:uncharacterized protein LOC141685812 [Apium graveolens]|uniref:uncharacterized protein LOC141685812 n=1 Tax=Apium graveolens TaxID=4045 RepID=UPI003D79AD8E
MDVRENDELRGKPAEDLAPVPLDPLDPEKVRYIGASLDKPLKGRMTIFLQENSYMFAWIAADIPGIDPNLITHRLNFDPTRKAGMDILGPLPVASGQRKFIMVAIDYFTKWIEAKALAKITTKQIAQFLWENANGQAEVANRIILDGLKKRVERSRNTWVDELLPILWAYHTTCKVTTKATPFMLAYGAEAVVPLEITHGSPRIEAYESETNEEGMRLALDLIDEVRDEANARNAEHQRRASLYYNRRVKERFL